MGKWNHISFAVGALTGVAATIATYFGVMQYKKYKAGR